jgi:hypothetical protein
MAGQNDNVSGSILTGYFANHMILFGAPAAIRTRGLRIRNPSLYPSELQGRGCWSERGIRLTRFAAGVNTRCPP